MISPLPSSVPEPHRKFLQSTLEVLRRDERLLGLAAGGSLLGNSMDEFSDLDLVIATEAEHHGPVLAERPRIARYLGPLLSAFTGEHVGEPRLLVCLYAGEPPLHLDCLSFLRKQVLGPLVLAAAGARPTQNRPP